MQSNIPQGKRVRSSKVQKEPNVEPPPNDKKKTVQVCVRLRPMNSQEQEGNPVPAWKWEQNTIALNSEKPSHEFKESESSAVRSSKYTFDHLFHPEHSTEMIFNDVVEDIVFSAMEGYHGTVFAYGQTSTGKTYTMQGTEGAPGIIPLAVEAVFDYISTFVNREFLLRVSYLEIYNEQVVDLLSPKNTTGIQILNNRLGKVMIRGLKEEVVVNPDQVYALITSGESYRHTAETLFNRESSRSHTLFRLVIESRLKTTSFTPTLPTVSENSSSSDKSRKSPRSNNPPIRVSVLNLVDLAGSEGGKANTSTGARRKEGHFINKSLHTLSHVIFKLSDIADLEAAAQRGESLKKDPRRIHIPYRDSKLTRLLQSSLSGNAQIAVVCTMSPAVRSLDESHNTLKFASRAKRVRSTAVVNEVLDDKALLKKYREEILRLKGQLAIAQQAKEQILADPQESQRELDGASERSSYSSADSDTNKITSIKHRKQKDENEEEVTELVNAIYHLERLILTGDKKEDSKAPASFIEGLLEQTQQSPRFFENQQHRRMKSRNFATDSPASSYFGSPDQKDSGETTPKTQIDSGESTPRKKMQQSLTNVQTPLSDLDASSILKSTSVQSSPNELQTPEFKTPLNLSVDTMLHNNGSVSNEPDHSVKKVLEGGGSPSSVKVKPMEEYNIKAELGKVKDMLHRVLLKKNQTQRSPGRNRINKQLELFPLSDGTSTDRLSSNVSDLTEEELNDQPKFLSPPSLMQNQALPNKKSKPQSQNSSYLEPHSFATPASIEILHKELEAQRLETSLIKSDSQFLEVELQKKQSLVNEMMSLLTDVENRQSALEQENEELRKRVCYLTNIITAQEEELLQLKGISGEEETF